MQDWLAVDYVHRNLPKIEGPNWALMKRAVFAHDRFKVLYRFSAGHNQVVVMSLDHGRVKGLTPALEQHYYAVTTRLSQSPRFELMSPSIDSTPGLNQLGYMVGAEPETLHYVVMAPKQDDWLFTAMPHAVIGIVPAFTWYGDTATVTLIGYEGDATSGAVEACQATEMVTATDQARTAIGGAVGHAGRHEPPDLKELAKSYVDLAQEAFCNRVGPMILLHDRGGSYDWNNPNYRLSQVHTPDNLVAMAWEVDKDLYSSLR